MSADEPRETASQDADAEQWRDDHNMDADDLPLGGAQNVEGNSRVKSNERRMTQSVCFRVAPAEHARLQAQAERSGHESVNAWARTVVRRTNTRSDVDDTTLRRLIAQLSKIGGRFEAVAKSLSDGPETTMQAELREVTVETRKVMLRIADILQ